MHTSKFQWVLRNLGEKKKMYKSDDEYAILSLTAPALSSLESQGTQQY